MSILNFFNPINFAENDQAYAFAEPSTASFLTYDINVYTQELQATGQPFSMGLKPTTDVYFGGGDFTDDGNFYYMLVGGHTILLIGSSPYTNGMVLNRYTTFKKNKPVFPFFSSGEGELMNNSILLYANDCSIVGNISLAMDEVGGQVITGDGKIYFSAMYEVSNDQLNVVPNAGGVYTCNLTDLRQFDMNLYSPTETPNHTEFEKISEASGQYIHPITKVNTTIYTAKAFGNNTIAGEFMSSNVFTIDTTDNSVTSSSNIVDKYSEKRFLNSFDVRNGYAYAPTSYGNKSSYFPLEQVQFWHKASTPFKIQKIELSSGKIIEDIVTSPDGDYIMSCKFASDEVLYFATVRKLFKINVNTKKLDMVFDFSTQELPGDKRLHSTGTIDNKVLPVVDDVTKANVSYNTHTYVSNMRFHPTKSELWVNVTPYVVIFDVTDDYIPSNNTAGRQMHYGNVGYNNFNM